MRVIFAGTPDFAVPSLEALLAAGHEVCAVYTQPDRPAGRGRKLRASPVKQSALAHDIDVRQPLNLKQDADIDALHALSPDVMVVVAYGLILPRSVLEIPRLGCINVHASLLPRWRGAAPIQRAIEAGDRATGVTIMQMNEGLDTGDMLLTGHCPVNDDDTAQTLHDRLADIGAGLLVQTLDALDAGTAVATAQDDAQTTYAARISKAEAAVDWQAPAIEIDRKVRAFNPWPVAFTRIDGDNLRIWESSASTVSSGEPPGTVVNVGDQGIDVSTGRGTLRLHRVQGAGKRAMSGAEFARGHDLKGLVLG